MRVAVVGGGVIGLACAWYLRRGGADVVVVERDEVGRAASSGNTGWVAPAFSGPLPAPGVTRQALRWTLSRTGPFALRPRLNAEFVAWCWRFWRSTKRERHSAGLHALVALNEHTLSLFDGLALDGVEFEMHEDGVLLLFLTERALEEELHVLEDVACAGYGGAVLPLSASEARKLEPTLGDGVCGAIHLPAERHVRPESLTGGLARALRANRVEIREGCEVAGLSRGAGGWRVRLSGDELDVDRVVLAAGVWTATLLAELGVRIPQQPAKGYSATLPRNGLAPRLPLYLTEARVSCSPFDDAVRLAGVLELGTFDLSVDRRRLAAMVASPADYLRGWARQAHLGWAGLRPLSADGLPLIGAVPQHEGLFVATGHGMLGVTLAPATGHALALLMLESRPVPELRPMRIERS